MSRVRDQSGGPAACDPSRDRAAPGDRDERRAGKRTSDASDSPRTRFIAACASSRILWILAIVLNAGSAAEGQELVRSILDRVGDAVARRMDSGADGPLDTAIHRQPDIVAVRVCRWQPFMPSQDLFTGAAVEAGDFFRLDIVFDQLVNPPGPTGCCGFGFDPFQYGEHPVFGYVEIDMDADANAETGGELDLPQLMFAGNAARFGGLPDDRLLAARCARDASAFDGNVKTPPLVDRSGEDFHVALHGWEITRVQRSGPADAVFSPGDAWVVTGRLFPRARGYERFSFADTNGATGRYSPIVQLRFAHSIEDDRTTVSLVYPLNNRGSAAQKGATIVEPLDGDAANQNSILEGLDDLVFGAENAPTIWRSDPAFALIAPWGLLDPVPGNNSAARFLNPLQWRITVLVGGSYTFPANDAPFIWSDVLPDVLPGDFNGDGGIDWRDRLALSRFISDADGQADVDEDEQVNCAVDIVNFGLNFSLFDTNYDGIVNAEDMPAIATASRVPGDLDGDTDVDQSDFGILQTCLGALSSTSAQTQCSAADLDLDHDVDVDDFAVLQACARGAAVPADPDCWPPATMGCPLPAAAVGARE